MSEPGDARNRPTQTLASNRNPPADPNTGASKGPANPGKTVYLLDQMEVRDLARALNLKPFKVVAELMEMKLFKSSGDPIDFDTASSIARKHGFKPERPPPGMLIL